jgi:hypothetical protein
MLNILDYKGNANQKGIKIGYHQQHKQQMLVRMQGKRNPCTLLVGM